MNNDDEALNSVFKKIERERALLNAANQMRQQTQNELVRSRIDTQMREGRRNIQYLEERMQELQMRKMGQEIDNMKLSPRQDRPASRDSQNERIGPPLPPPKDQKSHSDSMKSVGNITQDYSRTGGHGDLMPLRHPFSPPGPGSAIPKRQNYSKLDLIKYDTPHLGPRIQLMLTQIEFKLNVEKQYLKGIEKMGQLYAIEGDRKSRADAAARRIESTQKIQILKQALKRYEDLHIDMESTDDAADDDSINSPNMRKPLTGQLFVRIQAVKDVDHATISRFARGPETFVTIKVEDNIVVRTRTTRNGKWEAEYHNVNVDQANEIELTVYDKLSDHRLPMGLLWIRISDIVEEMRKKRIEAEINNSGWVSADRMGSGSGFSPSSQFLASPSQQSQSGPSSGNLGMNSPTTQSPALGGSKTVASQPIDAWFALEPAGAVHLSISFTKQTKEKRGFDAGLNRKGAIRQRKEEIHEMYGHKFISQQFYNIMRCALCGDFLKYSGGMQCEDCKYTCHTKCYTSVVTKCISKSNAETDPDEEKINHRIPHRFEKFSNMSANWCCHCGYILPFGKKNCRKCTECSLTCHAQCIHLVPDFCGMSMAVANVIIDGIKNQKRRQITQASSIGEAKQDSSIKQIVSPTENQKFDNRTSYSQEPSRLPLSGTSQDTAEAAKTTYTQGQTPSNRASVFDKPSSSAATAAAAAAMSGPKNTSAIDSHGKPPTDYQHSRIVSGSGFNTSPTSRTDNSPYKTSQKPQSPSQSSYNPAAYAQVSGYPTQPLSSAQLNQTLSSNQQLYNPPVKITAPQTESNSPATSIVQRKVAPPQANEPGTGRRIGLDHFNFLAVLGKGNFGKVMLAEAKATKKLYAIKVLKKEFIIENEEVESTRSEKRVFLIANKERHPFLTNLHACFQTETRVYFVMEYISGGDLMLHIQRGQFGTKRAQFYAAEVCLALKYFHENGVIYRDLKLDNILLTLDGHIKMADYGLCKEDMWYGSTTSTFCGTPEFMAPEILLDKKYGRSVDWWAFGVLIYQMLLQQSPFRGEDEDEIYDAILADEPLYPIHMPRDSVSILQKLLTREPDQRLGSGPTDALEIMSQPFFSNINWDDIYNKRIPTPFKPTIKDDTDTSNFDTEFTSVTPVLTPVQSVLTQAMQEEFRGFSYSADVI
ncbi:Protein kinase C-like [Golovinomyces cichoracearum]|uniref:protein kinase C n=1 Tax=Golovinomyces cichoracearum TaxID=62708 RepID=A0A420IC79_9PEZI|nr:Protein kinase C-like [Golovinomyces cichoracearum]